VKRPPHIGPVRTEALFTMKRLLSLAWLATMAALPLSQTAQAQQGEAQPTEQAQQGQETDEPQQVDRAQKTDRVVPVAVVPVAMAPPASPALPAGKPKRRTVSNHAERTVSTHGEYDALVATHARANAVPEALVHRVIVRESRYQPALVGRGGTIGLMQIKLATARSLGYTGDAEGLRDPNTNLTYAVKYLAGAYRAANGDHNRAIAYYASGYYAAAKRQRLERGRHPALEVSPPQEAEKASVGAQPVDAKAEQVPE
jgi:soluble lytic murein transglycosylase-like protein